MNLFYIFLILFLGFQNLSLAKNLVQHTGHMRVQFL